MGIHSLCFDIFFEALTAFVHRILHVFRDNNTNQSFVVVVMGDSVVVILAERKV